MFLHHVESNAVQPRQALIFNVLVGCTWITYLRACFTSPGHVPAGWSIAGSPSNATTTGRSKWCKKCEAFKPQRAHHCKICKRWTESLLRISGED